MREEECYVFDSPAPGVFVWVEHTFLAGSSRALLARLRGECLMAHAASCY